MMDITDISVSSGGYRRRTSKAMISSSQTRNNKLLRVRFSSVADGPLSLGIRVFANREFVSLDLNDRKQVWYTGLEIRAMKQANIDHVAEKKRAADHDDHDDDDDDDEEDDWRGLEHIVEGETKRRQRIQHFVCSLLKIQSERQRKGSKPEAIADALGAFSRSQSRGDRRRAQKVGKIDYANSRLQQQQQQQQDLLDESQLGNSSSHSLASKPRSFLSSSVRRHSNTRSHRRRASECDVFSQSAVRRSLSADNECLQKRKHVLRRMSDRAKAAMLPHKRHSATAAVMKTSSSRSLQSTGSTVSATSSSGAVGVSLLSDERQGRTSTIISA
jgi:hypothetical protein